jgi:hypothetical protein
MARLLPAALVVVVPQRGLAAGAGSLPIAAAGTAEARPTQRSSTAKQLGWASAARHGMLSPGCSHGVLAMVILGRMLTWFGFIVATGLLVMAGLRFYQGFTGNYAYTEAFGDPVGAAILYLMMAAVTWLLGMLAGHLVEEDA